MTVTAIPNAVDKRVAVPSRRSARRAVSTRSNPCAANTSANAAPMPDEAPVINAVRRLIRSLDAPKNKALEVIGFGNADEDGMVASLHPLLHHRQRHVAVDRRLVDHVFEHVFGDVVRAAA